MRKTKKVQVERRMKIRMGRVFGESDVSHYMNTIGRVDEYHVADVEPKATRQLQFHKPRDNVLLGQSQISTALEFDVTSIAAGSPLPTSTSRHPVT